MKNLQCGILYNIVMTSRPNKGQDDLDDIYPDLSDSSEEQKPQIQKKQSTKQSKQNPNPPVYEPVNKIIAPAFLGGVAFIPPPPPPPPHGFVHNSKSNAQDSSFPKNIVGQSIQRERKNCIYIKNIPKTLNKVQKLNTFFRTFGGIKNIKSNQEDLSAVVRFQKQQDALKFYNSQSKVFNRSFIIYDFQQNIQVNAKMIQQRQKDQQASLKTIEQETIKLRQNAQTIIADEYRCLLFIKRQQNTQSIAQQVDRQMIKCRRIKQSKTNDEQVNKILEDFENEYDWTIILQMNTTTQIDKKKIIQQYHKHGSIGTIQIRLVPSPNSQNPEEKIGIIKIKFLGVKSSWLMFKENYGKLNIQVEGKKLSSIYKQWHAKITTSEQKQEQIKPNSNAEANVPAPQKVEEAPQKAANQTQS